MPGKLKGKVKPEYIYVRGKYEPMSGARNYTVNLEVTLDGDTVYQSGDIPVRDGTRFRDKDYELPDRFEVEIRGRHFEMEFLVHWPSSPGNSGEAVLKVMADDGTGFQVPLGLGPSPANTDESFGP